MANRRTIQRIMDVVGIEPRQIDLVEKVLRLESDKKRVHSVKLRHGTLPNFNLWAEVYLLENFKSVFEFKAYLVGRGLPSQIIDSSHDGITYLLDNDGIRVEFKKFANYLKK